MKLCFNERENSVIDLKWSSLAEGEEEEGGCN